MVNDGMNLELDFEDRRLPTLNFKLWVSNDNMILYTFFEKCMASNQMIQKGSSIPENIKMATLNIENVKRMQNIS